MHNTRAVARRDVFESVIAEEEPGQMGLVTCDTGSSSRLVMTQIVTPEYFEDLGIRPALGRLLSRDDASGSEIGAVLSFQFWQSAFGGDSQVIGKTIRLKKHPVVILGVLRASFTVSIGIVRRISDCPYRRRLRCAGARPIDLQETSASRFVCLRDWRPELRLFRRVRLLRAQ